MNNATEKMTMPNFWDNAPCSLVGNEGRFRGAYGLMRLH